MYIIFKQKTANADDQQKLKIYKNYLEFELKLAKGIEKITTPNNKLNERKNQICDDPKVKVELEEVNFQRIQLKCLFERAISDNSNCLDESLWLKYIYYLVSATGNLTKMIIPNYPFFCQA